MRWRSRWTGVEWAKELGAAFTGAAPPPPPQKKTKYPCTQAECGRMYWAAAMWQALASTPAGQRWQLRDGRDASTWLFSLSRKDGP